MFSAIKSFLDKRQSTRIIDAALTAQLKTYLEKLRTPVELVASLDDSSKAMEMRTLLAEIVILSDKIVLREDGSEARTPSFSIARPGEAARIRFAGIPLGQEFTSLVLALLHTGGHPPKVEPEIIEQIRAIGGPLDFATYMTLSCHNCPDVVQALNLMAVVNPAISHTMIDGALFLSEIDQFKIKVVPTVHLNGQFFDQGRKTVEQYIEKIGIDLAA
ncbi:MAG: thioredoxin family protein [Betaproteobacteria bacterium]